MANARKLAQYLLVPKEHLRVFPSLIWSPFRHYKDLIIMVKIDSNDTYLESHGDVYRAFVVDIDGDLALIHILRVVIDDDSFDLPVLATEGLGAEDFVRSVSPGDANHIEKLLLDNPEGHKLFDFDLILERLSRKGHRIALAVAEATF